MSFQQKDTLPDFQDLKSVFTGAGQQTKDPAFYQTIVSFISRVSKLKNILNTRVEDNETNVFNLLAADFLTSSDESDLLPNSRNLLAGTGIAFDDVTDNERTISTASGSVRDAGYWSPLILDGEDNGDSEMIITDSNAPIAIWNPTP